MKRLFSIRGGNAGGDEYRVLNVPRARVGQVTGAVTTNGGDMTLSFDALGDTGYDTDAMFALDTPTRLTIRSPGLYAVWQYVNFPLSGAGANRQSWVELNSTGRRWAFALMAPYAGQVVRCFGSDAISCNKEDFLELHAYQDSGGNLTLNNYGLTTYAAELKICLISTIG